MSHWGSQHSFRLRLRSARTLEASSPIGFSEEEGGMESAVSNDRAVLAVLKGRFTRSERWIERKKNPSGAENFPAPEGLFGKTPRR
jgi:hypothetical protein